MPSARISEARRKGRTGLRMLLSLAVSTVPCAAAAQGVVVDQGTFAVSVDGRQVGTEEFTIRQAGINLQASIFASATVDLRSDGGTRQIRLLLKANPADGLLKCEGTEPCYQIDVVGTGAMSLRLGRSDPRFVARIVDETGEEIREFPAHEGTRILENDVAHLYYFLRDVQQGALTPILSPADRERTTLEAGPAREEQIQLGANVVQARRIEFFAGDDRRVVWFDRLGRVLRVSVPSHGYTAERTDLVG